MDRSTIGTGLGIIAITALVIFVTCMSVQWDHDRINAWADQHGYRVVSAELTFFDNGPFFIRHKDDRVYRVEVDTPRRRTCYFIFRFWWQSHQWADDSQSSE